MGRAAVAFWEKKHKGPSRTGDRVWCIQMLGKCTPAHMGRKKIHAKCRSITNVCREHLCNVFPFTPNHWNQIINARVACYQDCLLTAVPSPLQSLASHTKESFWQLDMEECDLTWVWKEEGCVLELLGKGSSFIEGHAWEDILLPVLADNEKTNVIIRLVAILGPWGNGY